MIENHPSSTSLQDIDKNIAFYRRQLSKLDSDDVRDYDQIQDIGEKLAMLREQRAELARAITLKKMEATA